MDHEFTNTILAILDSEYGKNATQIFERSPLLQYLNLKTRSAMRGSKSRSSFANHYALYVLIEDYLKGGFEQTGKYAEYKGAKYSDLLSRQRELPFGRKLQNHALNHRLNEEFKKFFPTVEFQPIIRDVETNRYWINENLLLVAVAEEEANIAHPIIKIINAYIEAKRTSFDLFINDCERLEKLTGEPEQVSSFVKEMIRPNVDARLFEIVSFSILKAFYRDERIYWGWSLDELKEDILTLYKTGRTNANDGGIDFVMKPLGRFFQVTETLDVKKYFLDIEKIQRFPLTFVIKSSESKQVLLQKLEAQAFRQYGVKEIVQRYMDCIEEIINIPILIERLNEVIKKGALETVLTEIILQSRVEFNYEEEDDSISE